MLDAPKTLVLVHGFFLQAQSWEDVVWGNPRNGTFGRASKGIMEALKFDADAIVFGTGTSEKDGLKEGEYTYRYVREHLADLEPLTGKTADDLRAWIEPRVHLELRSHDTTEEVRAAVLYAKEIGARRIILVSSPTHILRCFQDALSVLSNDQDLRGFSDNLYVTASDVSYAGTTVDDVAIIEPPHRPDRPNIPFNKTAKKLLPFFRTQNTQIAEDFNEAWAALIEAWKRKL